MTSKQPKKYCRIIKYIEKTDAKLYEILDDLCMTGVFKPRRFHGGLTFIWPSADTIKELDKLRYQDDIERGCDIVLGHIIHDYLPSLSAWKAKQSDLPNGLNNKLEVKDIGSKVVLADGAELEHDDAFKMFSRGHENQAVWRVKKGAVDYKKHTKRASFEHTKSDGTRPPRREFHQNDKASVVMKKLGGDILSYFNGGNTLNNDICSKLVSFGKSLTDPQQIAEFQFITSPLLISTVAFLYYSPSLGDAFANHVPTRTYTYQEYCNMDRDGHAKLNEHKTGGATLDEIRSALTSVWESSKQLSSGVAEKLGLKVEFVVALGLSRKVEADLLNSANVGDIADCVSVIMGYAANGLASIQSVNSMFVQGFLDTIKNYVSSEFVNYPMSESWNSTQDKLCKLYSPMFNDDYAKLLANIPRDVLLKYVNQS